MSNKHFVHLLGSTPEDVERKARVRKQLEEIETEIRAHMDKYVGKPNTAYERQVLEQYTHQVIMAKLELETVETIRMGITLDGN